MKVTTRHIALTTMLLALCLGVQHAAYAQPFGKGVFGANVPFGSMTSLSIALSNNTNITMTPNGGSFTGTGSHTVTVTSTDVVGYDLYVNATSSTAMSNGTDTVAASANATAGTLANNTWGYNTTGSTTNFVGMTGSQTLIKGMSGPYTSGDATTVTYGAQIDTTKSSGTYSVGVTYTAIGRS